MEQIFAPCVMISCVSLMKMMVVSLNPSPLICALYAAFVLKKANCVVIFAIMYVCYIFNDIFFFLSQSPSNQSFVIAPPLLPFRSSTNADFSLFSTTKGSVVPLDGFTTSRDAMSMLRSFNSLIALLMYVFISSSVVSIALLHKTLVFVCNHT